MTCTNRLVERNQDQNATLDCVVQHTDSSGVALDMTGYTMKLTIKEDADDTDANAVAQTIITGDATGIFDLSTDLSGIATGTYRYDVITIDPSNNREVEENSSIIIKQTVAD